MNNPKDCLNLQAITEAGAVEIDETGLGAINAGGAAKYLMTDGGGDTPAFGKVASPGTSAAKGSHAKWVIVDGSFIPT